MQKVCRILLFVFLLTLSLAVSAGAVDVCINGYAVTFDTSTGTPFIDGNNRTQVPLRQTMEAFGAKVDWNAGFRHAVVMKKGITVTVPVDCFHILVNDKQVNTDTAAMIVNNRTYLPIRAVAEAFGANVSWDGNTVNISTYEGMYSYTLAQAQSIALLHAGYSHADVVFLETTLVYQNSWVFLLSFCDDYMTTYHYVVDANTGQVLSYDQEDTVSDDEEGTEMSTDQILSQAISYAGLEYATDVQMTNISESSNGISTLYTVTLVSDGYTYVLQINADTGEIRQLELSYTAPSDDGIVYDDMTDDESTDVYDDNTFDDYTYDESYGNDDTYDYDDDYSYDDDSYYDDEEDNNSYANEYGFDESYNGSYEDVPYEDNPADYDYGYKYGDSGSFDDYDFNFGNEW